MAMADFADHGSDAAQRFQDDALRLHQAKRQAAVRSAAGASARLPGQPHCIGCGEQILAARIEQNPHTRRCTPCASENEVRT